MDFGIRAHVQPLELVEAVSVRLRDVYVARHRRPFDEEDSYDRGGGTPVPGYCRQWPPFHLSASLIFGEVASQDVPIIQTSYGSCFDHALADLVS